MAELVEGPR